MKKFLALAFACALIVPSAFAANNWNGTWKLDQARSHLTGTTFTYSKAANGLWRMSDGNFSFDFAPNGKPYPAPDKDDTMITRAEGSHTLVMVNQFKGKTTSTTRETLSADGNTLTDHTTGTRPDGSAIHDTTVSIRVGAGSGFLGTWKSTHVSQQPNEYVVSTAPDGTLTWIIPSQQLKIVGKPDGSLMHLSGPTISPSFSLVMKQSGSNTLELWTRINGKAVGAGKMTLSADGKWLTNTSWTVGKSNEKTTGIYHKQ